MLSCGAVHLFLATVLQGEQVVQLMSLSSARSSLCRVHRPAHEKQAAHVQLAAS